jgi:AraC-like DNA-binding protein
MPIAVAVVARVRDMPITVSRKSFSDFEALNTIAQDGRSVVMQLAPGKMSGTLTHLTLDPSLRIATGFFSRAIRASGVPSHHRWMFGMVHASNGKVSFLQDTVKPGDLVVVAPGRERYTSYQDAASFSMTFIEPHELEAFLGTHPEALDELDRLKHRPTVLPSDPATAAANIAQMTTVAAALTEHAGTLSDDSIDFYKRGILELLTDPLRAAAIPSGGRHPRAAALVRDVDQYLVDAGTRPVHVSELCQQFKVHRRLLLRAFTDVHNMPPRTFVRRKRLCDVHTALVCGGPDAAVKAIAIEHGFLELGRFAGEYRRQFGELPSQTLRRAQRKPE